jgi:hypothetical protein
VQIFFRLELIAFATLIATVAVAPASADEHRSRAVAREFQREHPCPSTGLPTGACPGYWRDHIVPLACGGAPIPSPTCNGRRSPMRGRKTCGSERVVQLDLNDEEAAALLAALNRLIDNDRYPLSPRVRTLRAIRAKLPGAPREPPPVATAANRAACRKPASRSLTRR